MTPLDALLIAGSACIAVPLLFFGAECLLACTPTRKPRSTAVVERPPIAVLVPAHNEAGQIAATVRSITGQLRDDDRLIVIADNCTDDTATIAESLGATVLARHDDERRGKGYAIRHGLEHLRADPPAVVVSIDADCLAAPGAIDRLVEHALETGRPVQSSYLMESPADAESGPKTRISEFAVLVKNHVRPLGLQRLGQPCLLTGSGMAFPWRALEATPHPESQIVEDMHYAVDLAINGDAPKPCMDARFTARLPSRDAAFTTQRTRWEHGHLATIRTQAPRLLGAFLRSGRPSLLMLLLELATPPLSLLVATAGVVTLFMAASWLAGFHPAPLAIVGGAGLFAAAALTLAWARYGRRVLPPSELIAIPGYILTKLPLYKRFLSKPESGWVRTSREPAPAQPGAPHFTEGAKPRAEDPPVATR